MTIKSKLKKSLLTLLFTSSLYAGGSHIQLLGGTSQVEDSDSAFVFGSGLDLVKTFNGGVELGVGVEVLYSDNEKYSSNMGADLSFLFGYNFQKKSDIPLAIRMGIGYGMGTIEDSYTQDGLVYQVGAEYEFSQKFGCGVKYKIQDFEIDLPVGTADANTKNTLVYLYFRK
jgi:hypothetical protein